MDFLTAHAAELRGMKDPEVLALAAREGRILISHDAGRMPGHIRRFGEAGNRTGGVFLIPQTLEIGVAIEELLLIWLVSEASEWEGRLEWLPLREPPPETCLLIRGGTKWVARSAG